MEPANVALLRSGLTEFGIPASEESVQAIMKHLKLVAEWNEKVNLTAITEEREMVLKHALDSATVCLVEELSPGMRVLDVGTGAGFPGVVLKCLMPSLDLSMVESLAKRCRFLEVAGAEAVAPLLGQLTGYEVVWGRAEEVGHDPRYRERFDVVVARAVADLRVLSEYCLPFCRVGGSFLAMKGPDAHEEVSGARGAVDRLGGEIAEVRRVELPCDAGARTLIRIKKIRNTSPNYPRKAGTPAKKPL